MKDGGDLDGRINKCRQESVGSVDFDQEYLENSKGAEREAQCAQGFKN